MLLSSKPIQSMYRILKTVNSGKCLEKTVYMIVVSQSLHSLQAPVPRKACLEGGYPIILARITVFAACMLVNH